MTNWYRASREALARMEACVAEWGQENCVWWMISVPPFFREGGWTKEKGGGVVWTSVRWEKQWDSFVSHVITPMFGNRWFRNWELQKNGRPHSHGIAYCEGVRDGCVFRGKDQKGHYLWYPKSEKLAWAQEQFQRCQQYGFGFNRCLPLTPTHETVQLSCRYLLKYLNKNEDRVRAYHFFGRRARLIAFGRGCISREQMGFDHHHRQRLDYLMELYAKKWGLEEVPILREEATRRFPYDPVWKACRSFWIEYLKPLQVKMAEEAEDPF